MPPLVLAFFRSAFQAVRTQIRNFNMTFVVYVFVVNVATGGIYLSPEA